MIIGLLALAYIFFGGGNQTFLLNPNLKKNVDTYVTDKNRKNEIYLVIKQVEKNEENFEKQTKKVVDKKLVDLNMNRASTTADFSAEYKIFYDSLQSLQNKYLDAELKIRSYIHPNEWNSITKKILSLPVNAKARKSLFEENQKLHDRLLKACYKYIPDSTGKIKAKAFVDEYKDKGDTLADAFLNLNYRYIKAVRPYHVTRKDFEPMRAKMLELRKNYSNYLVEMRFKLLALTPEKQWNDLAKELNNYFVYMGAGVSK
jgi:hypothetical protein